MKRPGLGFAGILIGMSSSVLMQTVIATSLPTIVGELGGVSLYSWVFAAYMLASTVTIPLFGRLADLVSRRTIYLAGLATFLTGILLAGLATSMPQLVAMRVLQGIGAGAVAPAALAAIGDLFGEGRQGRAFGMIGAVQVLANLAGPALGGWVTDSLGWRWGFFLVLIPGALAALCAAVGLAPGPASSWRALRQVDWTGGALLAGALASGLIGLQALGAGAFGRAAVLVGLAALLLLACLRVCRGRPDSALPLALLAQPVLGQAALGALLLGAVTQGVVAYVPLYVSGAGSAGATGAGLALLPMLLMVGAGSAAGGWLERRHPRPPALAAWLLTLSALAGLAVMQPAAESPWLKVATGLIGLGMGLLMPLFLGAASHASGESHRAAAGGAIQLARNLGGAVSVPLLGIWLAAGAIPAIFATLAAVAGVGLLTTRRHTAQ